MASDTFYTHRNVRYHMVVSKTTLEDLEFSLEYLERTLAEADIHPDQLRFYAQADWDGFEALQAVGYKIFSIISLIPIAFDISY